MRRTWMLVLVAVVALGASQPAAAQPLLRLAAPPVIATPANGATVKTVHLTGTTDPGTTGVVVTEDGTGLDPVTPGPDNHWALDRTPPDGPHTYSAHSLDAAGASSAESAPITVTVDATPPAVPTIATPGSPARTIQLAGTADRQSVVVVSEGGNERGRVTADGSGHWVVAVSGLADGPHTFVAHAEDAFGNTSADSPAVTVVLDTVAPAAPVVLDPAEGAVSGVSGVDVRGSASGDAATVDVYVDDAPVITGVPVTAGSWSTNLELSDGAHTLTATAADAAGNVSPRSAERHIVVDTQPPDTTITSGPDGPTNAQTVTFTLGASEDATFSCRLQPGVTSDCGSSVSFADLPEGAYTFTAVATDRAAHPDPTPATRTFTIDRTAPAAPVVSGDPGGLSFASDDPGASFECSVDGGAPAPCATSYASLAPGSHTLAVAAVDRAGNRGPQTRHDFTIAAVQPSTPSESPPPAPQFHHSVVVRLSRGTVRVRKPGSSTYVKVSRSQSIPLGSTLDTKHGAITLLSAPRKGGKAQKAVFNGGVFRVAQPKAVTVLTLTEPLAACHAKASAAAKRKPKARRLWGSGSGAFSTHGRYSAATIRGTRWLVQDSCAGTLTRVLEGVVTVRDNVRHRTVLLRAGKRYLARH